MKPILILCQGRSGGTFFADRLARLPWSRLILEPFYPQIAQVAAANPKESPAVLRHRVRAYPNAGWQGLDLPRILAFQGRARLEEIARQSQEGNLQRAPVVKVVRHVGRWAEIIPEGWKVLHLVRDFEAQEASRRGIWADARAIFQEPDLDPREVWEIAAGDGMELSDLTVRYEDLVESPEAAFFEVVKALELPWAWARTMAASS